MQISTDDLKKGLPLVRRYTLELCVVGLCFCVFFLFKSYVSYLGRDRETMIKIIDNNTDASRQNADLTKELIQEVREANKATK